MFIDKYCIIFINNNISNIGSTIYNNYFKHELNMGRWKYLSMEQIV